jgi:hypothetical protein
MSASSLSDLLAGQLPSSLALRARTLLQTQDALERSLPAALAGHVRVMQLDSAVLSVACDSGAIASRLRHQTDALIDGLRRRGVEVVSVRVAVRPELLARYVPVVVKPGVPPAALEGLAHLNAEIADGPLKEALGRLLRHHRNKS